MIVNYSLVIEVGDNSTTPVEKGIADGSIALYLTSRYSQQVIEVNPNVTVYTDGLICLDFSIQSGEYDYELRTCTSFAGKIVTDCQTLTENCGMLINMPTVYASGVVNITSDFPMYQIDIRN